MSQIGQCQDGFSSAIRTTRSTIVCVMRGLPGPVRRLYVHLSAISFRYPSLEGVGCDQGVKPVQLGLPRVTDLFVRHLYNWTLRGSEGAHLGYLTRMR